ncbi:MAG: TM0996/MTH895 family glutaredoxin-like protein [Deltaproteobacteria bacterium]|nr:TM0996/MTH895 family glutaredoxin-like protein [Deltaproteobacteria bacterium]
MEVKVLGPGCTKCKKLYEQVDQSIKQLGLSATLAKVEKIEEIMGYGVLATPALVINGEVKVSGRLPSAAELSSWLTTAAMAG